MVGQEAKPLGLLVAQLRVSQGHRRLLLDSPAGNTAFQSCSQKVSGERRKFFSRVTNK